MSKTQMKLKTRFNLLAVDFIIALNAHVLAADKRLFCSLSCHEK